MYSTVESIRLAIASAKAGDVIYIAAGLYVFTSPIQVPDGVRVIGSGPGFTICQFPVIPTTADTYGFVYSGENSSAISDLTIEGPATASSSGRYSFGIYVNGTSPAGGSLYVKNVSLTRPAGSSVLTGGWYQAIRDNGGLTTDIGPFELILDNADITGIGGVNMYCDPYAKNKKLTMFNCFIHDTGTSHGLYIHPGISIKATRCKFDNIASYTVQHYSAGAKVAAEKCQFIECEFGSGITHGVLTSDQANASTTFINCTFRNIKPSNAGIIARSPITVVDCLFDLGAAANGISGTDVGIMDILGSQFKYSSGTGNGAAVAVTNGIANISSCEFDLKSGGTGSPKGVWIRSTTAPVLANIEGCRFHSTRNNTNTSDAPIGVYISANGRAVIGITHFDGYYQKVYGAIHADSLSASAAIDTTEFACDAGIRPVYQSPGGTPGAINWGTHNVVSNNVAPQIIG